VPAFSRAGMRLRAAALGQRSVRRQLDYHMPQDDSRRVMPQIAPLSCLLAVRDGDLRRSSRLPT
jgi:hypothetical protein